MKKSTLRGILIALVVIALIISGIALASAIEKKSEKAPTGAGTSSHSAAEKAQQTDDALEDIDYEGQELETISIDGKEYRLNENISTLLLIGVDDMEIKESPGNRNGAMSDFLALAVFDNEKKTCRLLQIDRNTVVDIPMLGATGDYIGLTTDSISFAHSYGDGLEESCENTALAVSRMLYNATVDNYISITMAAIPALNDVVGGVTVKIEDDFSGVDDTLKKGETVTLHGEHAMNFVRSRMNMKDNGLNTARLRRQRTYMTALAGKLREKLNEDEAFIFDVYNAVAEYLITDYDVNELGKLSEAFADYELEDIVTLKGEDVVEDYEYFYLDDEALRQTVAELFYIPVEG